VRGQCFVCGVVKINNVAEYDIEWRLIVVGSFLNPVAMAVVYYYFFIIVLFEVVYILTWRRSGRVDSFAIGIVFVNVSKGIF